MDNIRLGTALARYTPFAEILVVSQRARRSLPWLETPPLCKIQPATAVTATRAVNTFPGFCHVHVEVPLVISNHQRVNRHRHAADLTAFVLETDPSTFVRSLGLQSLQTLTGWAEGAELAQGLDGLELVRLGLNLSGVVWGTHSQRRDVTALVLHLPMRLLQVADDLVARTSYWCIDKSRQSMRNGPVLLDALCAVHFVDASTATCLQALVVGDVFNLLGIGIIRELLAERVVAGPQTKPSIAPIRLDRDSLSSIFDAVEVESRDEGF
mmetsp:Transcript_114572/g.272562  ORF Transcript_114572/g.272562 Transcript_114572/m.272562 type:complete len:268 (-) Transcript_114572:106-909(-)